LPMTTPFARRLAALAVLGCAAALTACTHGMPASPTADRPAAGDDDPWFSRGSVSAGAIHGGPAGPYSPR
jgi:hypothetical protein